MSSLTGVMFKLKQCISSDWIAYAVQGPYRNRIAIESQAVSCVRAAGPCSGGCCDYPSEYGGPMTGGEIRDELFACGELCYIG
jgi:hypothetical protein